jgi:hypothetical protein
VLGELGCAPRREPRSVARSHRTAGLLPRARRLAVASAASAAVADAGDQAAVGGAESPAAVAADEHPRDRDPSWRCCCVRRAPTAVACFRKGVSRAVLPDAAAVRRAHLQWRAVTV